MLRLPPHRVHRPASVAEAVELLGEHGEEARIVAGGTDLIPNMKHGLFEPAHLVAVGGLPELGGVVREGGRLSLGAGLTLAEVARSEAVRRAAPSLAEAAGQVAGPQIRNAGTLGGNLCLDTRCTYYNQTRFWRRSLGYCLKKEGDTCHVTRVGRTCVAAHSADTPPVLMTLGARLRLTGPDGTRTVEVADFFRPDGTWNQARDPGEVVTRIEIDLPPPDLRATYVKLRQRGAVDFPLLGVALAARMDADDRVREIRGVVTGLGARPRTLTGWDDLAEGRVLDDDVVEALARRAHAQCHPLENMITDPEWRRAMVPVHVRRGLERLRGGPGG